MTSETTQLPQNPSLLGSLPDLPFPIPTSVFTHLVLHSAAISGENFFLWDRDLGLPLTDKSLAQDCRSLWCSEMHGILSQTHLDLNAGSTTLCVTLGKLWNPLSFNFLINKIRRNMSGAQRSCRSSDELSEGWHQPQAAGLVRARP